MSESYISFGPLNRKILIPFLLALNQILNNIFELFYPGNSNQIFKSYSTSIGHMLILIIPRLMSFSSANNQSSTKVDSKSKACTKKNFLHYFILIVLYNIETLLLFIPSLLDKKYSNTKLPHEQGPFTRESITIILIIFIYFFFLKNKYHSHNIISLIIFIITGIIMDLILDNFEEFSNRDYKALIIDFFATIFEVLNFCYQKYMIDNLYHFFYNVVFALGLDLFICNTLTLIFYLFQEEYRKLLSKSFEDSGLLISRFFITMIFQFIYFLLRILTLVYFTPTHLLICLSLSKFIVLLINKDSSLKYLSIIPFIFQFFSLMIFLEIIELNFCGLNKNIKRIITMREEQDRLLGANERGSVNSVLSNEIEYSPGYYYRQNSGEFGNDLKENYPKGFPVVELKTQNNNIDEE